MMESIYYLALFNNYKMIIPIRCFTCGKVIADKWNAYKALIEKDSPNKDINKKFKRLNLIVLSPISSAGSIPTSDKTEYLPPI